MLKKRLIGVITVKDGWAVQSFSYKRYLPLGKPEVLAENLDRWGVDEILLQCIDRSAKFIGPDFAMLEMIGRKGLATPLIYAGGVRSVDDGVEIIRRGADRICFDAILHDVPELVPELSHRLGAQALIAGLPLAVHGEGIGWLDYRTGISKPLQLELLQMLREKQVSEALLIDWQNEGCAGGFDFRLLEKFPPVNVSLIAFGGLSEASQLQAALAFPSLAAVAIGNFLNYREHSVLRFKEQLADSPLRLSV